MNVYDLRKIMQQLIDFIHRYAPLEPEAIAVLEEVLEEQTLSRHQFLLSEGQRCHKIWFVKSGMIRKFQVTEGEEVTTWIHFEDDIVTSLDSYFLSKPSSENLQACEETVVLGLSKQNSQRLQQFPHFMLFLTRLLGEQTALMAKGSADFKAMSAAEKYLYLQRVSPQLIKRAKLGHIASIMGVKQATLSRIRSKVVSR